MLRINNKSLQGESLQPECFSGFRINVGVQALEGRELTFPVLGEV